MSCTCPTCGQEVPPAAGITYDDDSLTAVVGGGAVVFTPMEGGIFEALLEIYPRTALDDWLLSRLYPMDPDRASLESLHVMVYHANRKLIGSGWRIGRVFQRGYRLEPREYVPKGERSKS